METDPIRNFQYILDLFFHKSDYKGNITKIKFAENYQFSSFSKQEDGKFVIEYIPIFRDLSVLEDLEYYKKINSKFDIILELENCKPIKYQAFIVNYTFAMDYKKDDPLSIFLILKEYG